MLLNDLDYGDFHHIPRTASAMLVSYARIARLLASACIVSIAVLSLVPGVLRPHTFLPGQAEHFVAYGAAGFFHALGYLSWRQRILVWICLAITSGVFEVLQNFVPGRSPNLFDALASTGGLTLGLVLGAVTYAVLSRKGGHDSQIDGGA